MANLGVSAGFTISLAAIDQSFPFYATKLTTTGTFYLDSNLSRGMKFIANNYAQSYKEYSSIS